MKSTEGLGFEAEEHLANSYYHGASLAYWSISCSLERLLQPWSSPAIQDLNNTCKTSLHALEVTQVILDHKTDDFSRVMVDSTWPLVLLESYLYTGNTTWERDGLRCLKYPNSALELHPEVLRTVV